MSNSVLSSGPSAPFRRCFFWLLLACVMALSNPWLESPDTRFYSPDIQTFEEVDGKLTPTRSKIQLDGRTYGRLSADKWLGLGLLIVAIEWIAFAIRRRF
ncbi:MAG: hypothetical protein HS117_09660 [Verrucomicrobiaceae bacterium]|nr:hypothetical protein [Verrucomicrobiaceae bacterium]